MCNYRWIARGIQCVGARYFVGECISNDIIKAIRLFREHDLRYSVHQISRAEQVSADENERILNITLLPMSY